jgi:peptidoglycan hydrolase-like protein with peptidoglycan-binding domain
VQIYLNNHGYTVSISGPGSLGKETNYFGPSTKQAVIKFQKFNNLTSDGILGQNTRTILNK